VNDQNWKPLDTKKALEAQKRQHEQTTTANVGAYPVPIGRPMRRAPIPAPAKPKKLLDKK
jgi:hypothetical protein